MLEDLLKFDSLGGRSELEFLIFNGLSTSSQQDLRLLRKYCSSNSYSFGKSFDGMIKLLEFTSIVKLDANLISLNFDFNGISKSNFFEHDFFYKRLIEALIKEEVLDTFFNPEGVSYDMNQDTFYIKNHYIKNKFFPIRNLLLSVGFLLKDSPIILSVHKSFNKIFWDLVIKNYSSLIKRRQKKKLSLDQLKIIQTKQEEAGREAELFVLRYEQQRLNGHPLYNSIERISDDFVNAGYDIISFNNKESISHNRFIEVKSFIGEISFYWSRNEKDVAETLGDKYYLYLIERNKMQEKDYSPLIIQNPFTKLFENDQWEKKVEMWKLKLLAPSG